MRMDCSAASIESFKVDMSMTSTGELNWVTVTGVEAAVFPRWGATEGMSRRSVKLDDDIGVSAMPRDASSGEEEPFNRLQSLVARSPQYSTLSDGAEMTGSSLLWDPAGGADSSEGICGAPEYLLFVSWRLPSGSPKTIVDEY